MKNVLSAGVYENIEDKTIVVNGDSVITTAAIVLTSKRGPTEPTTVYSVSELVANYGLPSRDNPALYCAMRYMREGAILTVVRVVVDATTASGALLSGLDPHLEVEAANPGAWGNNIVVSFGAILGNTDDSVFAVSVSENGEEVERFEVSRDPDAVDGFGETQYIEDVINRRSRYIRVNDNPAIADPYDMMNTVSLTGGADDTIAPTSTQIAAGWEPLVHPQLYDAQILINAGWASVDVQQKMLEVAKQRGDCRAILDVPRSASEDVNAMIAHREAVGIDDKLCAMYGGWIKVRDPYSGRDIMLPPSGDVAAIYVKTFRDYSHWDAPAGMRRGVLNALGVSKVFDENERDQLYVNGINPVTTYGGVNAVVWGQKSMQRAKSALDRMNVVNNVLWLTRTMKESLRPYVFEPNVEFLRNNVNYILTSFLEGVKNRGGLYGFMVDTESENTAAIIDSNQMIVNVYIQPVRTAEMIRLNLVVTPTGVELG